MTSQQLDDQISRQRDIINFLKTSAPQWDRPNSRAENIEIIETHGATVLLGEEFALKLKKAVHFDHMDYGSPDRRRHFCERELSFNQKTAPDLYIGVKAVRYDENTGYSLAQTGEIVDYFLKMRRFPKGARLDEVAANGDLHERLVDELGDAIIRFHHQAQIVINPASVPDFHNVIDANFLQLDVFCPHILELEEVKDYRTQLHETVDAISPLLSKRIETELVRWGHGDLHLQNMCILDGKPLLFDAIEYQDEFVISDILYDLSFLIMDLWEKKLRPSANRIFNRYLNGIGWTQNIADLNGLSLLPFYLSMRAGIRVHVEGYRFEQSNEQSKKDHFATRTAELFKSSQQYLNPPPAQMVAIGGYSGSGKSTLASRLAPYLGVAPGAVHLRSDVIRRQIMSWDEFSPMPSEAYVPKISQRVYDTMLKIAGAVLDTGHSVIMDAVLDREVDQLAFEQIAKNRNIPFTGIWLDVDQAIMESRIEGRTRDASDATVEVLHSQLTRNPKKKQIWNSLDGNGTALQSLTLSLTLLGIEDF